MAHIIMARGQNLCSYGLYSPGKMTEPVRHSLCSFDVRPRPIQLRPIQLWQDGRFCADMRAGMWTDARADTNRIHMCADTSAGVFLDTRMDAYATLRADAAKGKEDLRHRHVQSPSHFSAGPRRRLGGVRRTVTWIKSYIHQARSVFFFISCRVPVGAP